MENTTIASLLIEYENLRWETREKRLSDSELEDLKEFVFSITKGEISSLHIEIHDSVIDRTSDLYLNKHILTRAAITILTY